MKAETLSNDGNTANVKVSYTLLNTPLSAETQLVKVDGHWYGKDMMEQLKKKEGEAGDGAAPAAAAPAAPKG